MVHHCKLKGFGTAVIFFVSTYSFGSINSTSSKGINSNSLALPDGSILQGLGVKIGQVEDLRPAIAPPDSGPNLDVNPAAVTLYDGQPIVQDMNLADGHAERVASVMISTDFTDTDHNGDAPAGVAYGASLYASSYVTSGGTTAAYQDAIVTMQYVAGLPNMRAVNNSWLKEKTSSDTFDGNSQLTLATDWLATKYPNALQVFSGGESFTGDPDTKSLPSDNFNGMTIGMLSKDTNGVYRMVSTSNYYGNDASGDRTSISLLAPGDPLDTGNLLNTEISKSGTSYAAPHVTGTVALLQQFGNYKITHGGGAHWTPDSRRHEVMKAVLINSADKIADDGTYGAPGDFLGMEKTVEDQGETWLDTAAYSDPTIPLDLRMGAGALNANRAMKQFRNGQFPSGATPVPAIGWDYGTTAGDESISKYSLAQELRQGSYVSITLAWDRQVLFNTDPNHNGLYDRGDTFVTDCCSTDLDLYLMPAGATDLSEAIDKSTSGEMSLEHIFSQIPTTQLYEIWVTQFSSPFGDTQNYALAWWTAPAELLTSQGDFDGSGVVDEQDYVVWRRLFGTNDSSADANGNGIVDAGDYVIWRKNLNRVVGSGSGRGLASVPEPNVVALLAMSLSAWIIKRGRRSSC